MCSERILALLNVPAAEPPRSVYATVLPDYWALTKPEINFLILITTSAGFYLGWPAHSPNFPLFRAVSTMLGTLLVASGAGTLNQYIERRFDALMRRTARRPLASGRLNPSRALWFGIALSVGGSIYLAVAVNTFTSLLEIFTLLSYLFFYTPLKRRTPLCTLAGAFPGAMPPLFGWAAVSGKLPSEAWILFGLLFLWQFPHFMAIAWMYRDDYYRAGYLVLPGGQTSSRFATLQTLLPLAILLPLSLLPTYVNQESLTYGIGALLFGLVFFWYAARFALCKSTSAARRLLAASIVYLPLLFVMMIVCRG
jgi:protoheme IX farnesyltransferase